MSSCLRISLILVSLSTVVPGVAGAQPTGAFTPTGRMTVARAFHTATLLPDGRVLIAGGRVNAPHDYRGTVTASAELYDPSTGTFAATGSMTTPRVWHTATLLSTGKVLIVGRDSAAGDDRTAELYDPATGTFTPTGETLRAQYAASATLLRNGKVLIAGGVTPIWRAHELWVSTPELYDPSTGTFASTGEFVGPGDHFIKGGPNSPAVTLLSDGRVLFAAEPFSEVYDPVSGAFSATGAMETTCGPFWRPFYISGRTATLLASGDVLVTGGGNEDCGRFAEAERYDPASGTFTLVGPMTRRRYFHTATPLPDGTVLIAGGESESGFSLITEATAEIYDPSTRTFAVVGSMQGGREGHTATLLQDGRVLLAGGVFFQDVGIFLGSLDTGDLYTPGAVAGLVPDVPTDGVKTDDLPPRMTPDTSNREGAASAPRMLVMTGAPARSAGGDTGATAAPSRLVATATGSGVTLTWIAPRGRPPVRYAISGGNAPHASNLPAAVTPDASTHYTIPALPPGTYHFTVSAIFADSLSSPSNDAAAAVSGAAGAAHPPSGVRAHVHSGYVTATWTPAPGAGTLYEVEIGDAPGRANVAVLTTTHPGVTLRANTAGYYLRVRAVHGGMVSAPSNEVFVAVPAARCAAPPPIAILLPVSTTNGETTLSWLPARGALAERYRVDGSGPAGKMTMTTEGTGTSMTARLEPGVYTIRVTAINACGESVASNAITFTSGGAASR